MRDFVNLCPSLWK